MSSNIFLSICIPSYNRPSDLRRLLESIDSKYFGEIEIVIKEDKSPKRDEIREAVMSYQQTSNYHVNYIENDINLGYDANIRSFLQAAKGKWIIYMGDDDLFIPTSLDEYIGFLKSHDDLGYVLRRYRAEYSNGNIEEYRYSNKDEFLEPGQKSIVEFFRRSVFISGFTFQRELFDDYNCEALDGTLLFQLYIQASICLKNKSAYCDIPITKLIEVPVVPEGVFKK